MIDRVFLDRIWPATVETMQRVEMASGMVFGSAADLVHRGLLWIAQQAEARRFDEFADWRDFRGPIRIDGLCFKPSDRYLTAEGWPLGTCCWYVMIDWGRRDFVTAETSELAVARAILYLDRLYSWRDIPRDQRPPFLDWLESSGLKVEDSGSESAAAPGGDAQPAPAAPVEPPPSPPPNPQGSAAETGA